MFAHFSSPDKGAVVAYFPSAKLSVVAAHLHGTSKAGVPEATYDAVRHKQLKTIGRAVKALVCKHSEPPPTGELGCALILAGDLNFRNESQFTTFEDKAQVRRVEVPIRSFYGHLCR